MTERQPAEVVACLRDAINAHDLDAVVGCFAETFRSELPAWPDGSFVGRETVRRNWGMLLSAIPDLKAEIVRHTVDGDTVWVEWEQTGTQPDGIPHLVRGMFIFGVQDGLAQWNRFYLQPVQGGPPQMLNEEPA